MKYYELLARHAIELRFTRFQGSGLCPGCWSYTCRACEQVTYSMRFFAARFTLGAPAKANVSWTLNDQRTLHETYATLRSNAFTVVHQSFPEKISKYKSLFISIFRIHIHHESYPSKKELNLPWLRKSQKGNSNFVSPTPASS